MPVKSVTKHGKSVQKIYRYFKEAEYLREEGRNNPELREELSKNIINNTARQNAVIGASLFIPGADFPVLTLNQMKMVIELAALYDKELSVQRARELVVTLGSGFVFRSFARQLLGIIPGPGFIVKGSVAYGGTVALGKLAQKYFMEYETTN